MILAGGELFDSPEQDRILGGLADRINETRAHQTLSCAEVIDALGRISQRLAAGEFTQSLTDEFLRSQVEFAARMLSADALRQKVETELGEDWETPRQIGALQARTVAIGVVMHVAAGNMDALPAWSVIEGLLTGNINILKLPQADSGLTIRFFQALIEESPKLRDFIYVFDTPSTDVPAMQRMAALSDGIAVWGGDAAVSAVRRLAPVGCKLIEWGHRLGFCYISGTAPDAELSALAAHITETRQLLCSSCQVIFLDTREMSGVHAFCERFLPVLEAAARRLPDADIGAAAELTLRRYTDELERILSGGMPSGRRVYQGTRVSVTACEDSALELSDMNGNVLVKRLPQTQVMAALRQAKDYLQTAGLICPASDREALAGLLMRGGVNRVLPPGQMSHTFPGESHDGEYALRRYTRTVDLIL